MQRGRRTVLAAGALALCGAWTRGGSAAPAGIEERAAAIRPRPDELRWRRIPWVTDLAEARRLARVERRPIFLWVTGDDPLERC